MKRDAGIHLWTNNASVYPGAQILIRIRSEAEANGQEHDAYAFGQVVPGKPAKPGLLVGIVESDDSITIEEVPADWRSWAMERATAAAVLADPPQERKPLETDDYMEKEGPFYRRFWPLQHGGNHQDSKGEPGWAEFVGLE